MLIRRKKFDGDFAVVDFKEGLFKGGRLLFEIGVTPFEPVGEIIMSCEVIFFHELADHLSCKKKKILKRISVHANLTGTNYE